MSKFLCKCGHAINLSQGYSGAELILLPEQRVEEIGDLLGSQKEMSDGQFYELIDEVKITVYRCPICRRLHLADTNEKNQFTSYTPE